jgi:hypothetical protein
MSAALPPSDAPTPLLLLLIRGGLMSEEVGEQPVHHPESRDAPPPALEPRPLREQGELSTAPNRTSRLLLSTQAATRAVSARRTRASTKAGLDLADARVALVANLRVWDPDEAIASDGARLATRSSPSDGELTAVGWTQSRSERPGSVGRPRLAQGNSPPNSGCGITR